MFDDLTTTTERESGKARRRTDYPTSYGWRLFAHWLSTFTSTLLAAVLAGLVLFFIARAYVVKTLNDAAPVSLKKCPPRRPSPPCEDTAMMKKRNGKPFDMSRLSSEVVDVRTITGDK